MRELRTVLQMWSSQVTAGQQGKDDLQPAQKRSTRMKSLGPSHTKREAMEGTGDIFCLEMRVWRQTGGIFKYLKGYLGNGELDGKQNWDHRFRVIGSRF